MTSPALGEAWLINLENLRYDVKIVIRSDAICLT